jgi:hypothetical protein
MPAKLLPCLAAVLLCAAVLVQASSRSPGHKLRVQRQPHAPSATKPNNRPIIGILTQAGLEEDTFVPANGSYIAASYVKFVEGGGARVVPILHDSPPEVVSSGSSSSSMLSTSAAASASRIMQACAPLQHSTQGILAP